MQGEIIKSQTHLLVDRPNQELIIDLPIGIDDEIRNHDGYIRRIFTKSLFNQQLINYAEVKNIYQQWRDEHEYLILRTLTTFNQSTIEGQNNSYIDNYKYKCVKASKRGNDVYRHLVKEKFQEIDKLNDIVFIDKKEHRPQTTKLLFITLTFKTSYHEPIDSWNIMPKLFNKFKANLTKKYGKISTFRTWESTSRYYAHIHCLIYFHKTDFQVIRHIGKKDQKPTFRIPKYLSLQIKKYFPYNIDIQACSSFKRGINEVKKYIFSYIIKDTTATGGEDDDKPLKTQAMIWLTNKQGYAISKDFISSITNEYIDIQEPKACDLTYRMCNSNQKDEKWEYIGMISIKKLKISPKVWDVTYTKPPPEVKEHIIQLLEEQNNSF